MERIAGVLEGTYVDGVPLTKALRRPEANWSLAVAHAPELASARAEAGQQVLFDLKYAGYVARQQIDIDRQARLAKKRIPGSFDYSALAQLRAEAREKFTRIRPQNLAQASRISGITPADVALLMVHLDARPTKQAIWASKTPCESAENG
jgi:tRNA uridine 5-carboxymethylaminomethyl modification enzyme